MNIYDQISIKIIKEQELIIGPVAWYEAQKVSGLIVENSHTEVRIEGDGSVVIDRLVSQYEYLYGRASREVCKEAAASLIASLSPAEIPSSLR